MATDMTSAEIVAWLRNYASASERTGNGGSMQSQVATAAADLIERYDAALKCIAEEHWRCGRCGATARRLEDLNCACGDERESGIPRGCDWADEALSPRPAEG